MSIRDTGAGIRAEDLAHIFEVFFQGEVATNVRHGGLGIGLPVVKNLLDLHGAIIEAHSDREGAGAEFIVRIPARIGRCLRNRSGLRRACGQRAVTSAHKWPSHQRWLGSR